jgi:hypothetical protein
MGGRLFADPADLLQGAIGIEQGVVFKGVIVMKKLLLTLFIKNRPSCITFIILLLTIAIILAAINACTTTAQTGESKSPPMVETPKGIEDCKYKIIWSSNIIYTNSYDKVTAGDNDIITVHGYFEKGKDGWVWKSGNVKLDEKYFGQIEIIQQITDDGYLIESYIVPLGEYGLDTKRMQLKTIKRWEGNESKELNFKADATPWVVNSGFKVTSSISTKFSMYVVKDAQGFPSELLYMSQPTLDGLQIVTMEEKGNFKIKVESSGCNWWVKVGVE